MAKKKVDIFIVSNNRDVLYGICGSKDEADDLKNLLEESEILKTTTKYRVYSTKVLVEV